MPAFRASESRSCPTDRLFPSCTMGALPSTGWSVLIAESNDVALCYSNARTVLQLYVTTALYPTEKSYNQTMYDLCISTYERSMDYVLAAAKNAKKVQIPWI